MRAPTRAPPWREQLLPDEDPDLRTEAGKFVDDPDQWFAAPNDSLGGRSPEEMVQAGRPDLVRNLLRSAKYAGIS